MMRANIFSSLREETFFDLMTFFPLHATNIGMKIGIIGGGAAGMMAAASALEVNSDAEIFLIEKTDELGKKVLISGGGRCNLTTGLHDVQEVLKRYPRGAKFLTKAMYAFSPEDVYAWFEERGVLLMIEDDLRVFPQSNNGKDVVKVFKKIFEAENIKVMFNSSVSEIKKCRNKFEVVFKDDFNSITADKVIITTGGQTYRQTGSTGDGYTWAAALGHKITDLAPSLSALQTAETWTLDVAGLSFVNASIVSNNFKAVGPILFTHKGISGPAVFAFSALVAFEKFDANKPLEVAIDVFPSTLKADLLKFLELEIKRNPKKSLLNILSLLVPKSLADIVRSELSLAFDLRAAETGKKELLRCVEWLKGIPLKIVARSAGEEFVTAGGVELSEINPSTMESLICRGLFFAGEILNIDGFTGGFNLQSAWATGRMAGINAAKE